MRRMQSWEGPAELFAVRHYRKQRVQRFEPGHVHHVAPQHAKQSMQ